MSSDHAAPQPLPATLPLPAEPTRGLGVFWRPNAAFADELAEALRGKRVLEVFSGNGYLAAMLAARGVDITATSLLSGHDNHIQGLFHPVIPMGAAQAAERFKDDHDLLLMSWPTVTRAALDACMAFGPGRPIAYIGEATDYAKGHLGGCATDEFFEVWTTTRTFDSYRGNMMEVARMGCVGSPLPQPSRPPPAPRP